MPSYKNRTDFFFSDSLKNFSNYSLNMAATDGIIDQQSYIIGPGDKFLIDVQGVTSLSNITSVNFEGYIKIEQAGLILVGGKSLYEAKEIIIKEMKNFYNNVKISVTLADFKRIKVSLLGNVVKPNTYTINGNTRLLEFINLSYGLFNDADLRNVSIIKISGKINKYDLIRFIRTGDLSQNVILSEGDRVLINKSDKLISIYGNIQFPGIYEYVEGDNLSDLIDLAGGFSFSSKKDSIEIISYLEDFKNTSIRYINYEILDNSKIELKPGDRVLVRAKPEFLQENYVQVNGMVKYPGIFRIEKYKTDLKSLLLNDVGGFLEHASLKDAYIIRTKGNTERDPEFDRLIKMSRSDMSDDEYDYLKARSRELKGKMVVDFERLINDNDTSENLILRNGDEIFIPEEKDFITLVGQVVNPGNILYKKGLSVDEYISLAGGYSWRAVDSDVRVIKYNTKEWIDADDVDKLEPGDVIWVPEETPSPKFWDVFKDSMLIVGQVAALITAIVAVIISARN